MTVTGDGGKRPHRFGTHLVLVMLLVTLPVIGLISALDYQEVEGTLIAEEGLLQEQTEKSVMQSIHLVDAGMKLFDNTLNRQMQEGFGPFIEEYERAGRDPGAMDLSRVQKELGEDMDLYIINASGAIEYTTYPPDLGLDFRGIPSFYGRITEIRLGDEFVADRILTEPASGRLRKYAYMPSPDHRYLFELGLICSVVEADRFDPQYQTLKEDLMQLNPALEEIRIFDCYGRLVNVTDSEDPTNSAVINPVALAVFAEKAERTMTDPATGRLTRYVLVDLSTPDYPSDTSRVVELIYTTAPLDARLTEMWFTHALVAVFASLIACCIAFPISRRITRPVQEIVDDVNAIARGDLEHRIRVSAGTEFTHLEESIGAMVDSLKGNIERLRASEETTREYSTRLSDLVRERTADLEESSQTAALYLDIMVHDINNANTIAIGYTQFLIDALEGERQEEARKMLSRLEQSSGIINSITTLREARESGAALTRVDLDRIIQTQVANHPAIRIRYEGKPVAVLADDLLSEVFTNLLGNAEKFGGQDVEITIRVEERDGEVLVSVEDDGPGIPDAMKNSLFGRFQRGEGALTGAGLGLYICRMLIERYSGRIRADDRVAGRPEYGTAIHFSLPKAPEE
ncbi:MAG: HAMP domain-containing histidine kinase [Methanoculleus sp.]|nr:HAMP domain-containing histidine kinase [Methanoculleus sp.]